MRDSMDVGRWSLDCETTSEGEGMSSDGAVELRNLGPWLLKPVMAPELSSPTSIEYYPLDNKSYRSAVSSNSPFSSRSSVSSRCSSSSTSVDDDAGNVADDEDTLSPTVSAMDMDDPLSLHGLLSLKTCSRTWSRYRSEDGHGGSSSAPISGTSASYACAAARIAALHAGAHDAKVLSPPAIEASIAALHRSISYGL